MARLRKPPRLWLRRDRMTRGSMWFILDGNKQLGTGCRATERLAAENKLLAYVQAKEAAKRPVYIYFLTADHPGFPIKIGTTITHKMRMQKLQTAIPYKIKMLAIMPIDDTLFERRLHRKFEHLRLNGEWFSPAPELLEYISTLVEYGKAA